MKRFKALNVWCWTRMNIQMNSAIEHTGDWMQCQRETRQYSGNKRARAHIFYSVWQYECQCIFVVIVCFFPLFRLRYGSKINRVRELYVIAQQCVLLGHYICTNDTCFNFICYFMQDTFSFTRHTMWTMYILLHMYKNHRFLFLHNKK